MVLVSDRQQHQPDTLVDLFAGCGGSGGGLLAAASLLNRPVKGHFVNHWDRAIEIHSANHPEHEHYTEDLFQLAPEEVLPLGTNCSLMWCSPSCTFFSVARGAACVNEQDRSHADTLIQWLQHVKPDVMMLENVKEWLDWCGVVQKRDDAGELLWARRGKPCDNRPTPGSKRETIPIVLTRGGQESESAWAERMLAAGYQRYEIPDKSRKGEYFRAWKGLVEAAGYRVEHRIMCSADYGDPTTRRRLILQAVRVGSEKTIVWPNPTHAQPDKDGNVPSGMRKWRTAREIIDWTKLGNSIFNRKKPLAKNTLRRMVVGLVKFGLKEFLIEVSHGDKTATCANRRVKSLDETLNAQTARGNRGIVVPVADFVVPNFGEAPGQEPRTHSLDYPAPTVTSHGAGGLVSGEFEFVVPHHAGTDRHPNVRSVDMPVSTITTTMRGERVCKAHVVHLKGKSTAQDVDAPLSAVTGRPAHYMAVPMLDHVRGTGVVGNVDKPVRTIASRANHSALVNAFMFALDQTGGAKQTHGTYSVDTPVRTLVTKANAVCVQVDLSSVSVETCRFVDAYVDAAAKAGEDAEDARLFVTMLVDELKRKTGIVAKPWIYVYYSSGSEGQDIDAPLPTVRTKAGSSLCYPVIECDGSFIRIDLLYRMLSVLELQRAMGFDDAMEWAGATQEECVKAIGNSVSHNLAKSLALAYWTQNPDVSWAWE